MKSLFGTSGIRGPAETFFTNQFCFDLGRAFDKFLNHHQQNGGIAIGMDPRQSSPRIKSALFQGLALSDRPLFDQGIVPIPAMNWILKIKPLAGSIMVTGSHVQPELNGLKFFAFKSEISKEHEAKISRIYHQLKEKIIFAQKKINPILEKLAKESYQKMLLKLADKPLPCWKVVVDPGNGSQSEVAPQILRKLGLKVISLNCTPSPEKFLTRDTESENAFTELASLVKKEKADFGIGFDSDGDRVVFIDEKGEFIPGDYTGALLAKYGSTKIIITPINTSQMVESLGKPVIRTKVGSPYVVEAMRKNQASFGFEANGGGIHAEVMMSRDGGTTMIKILNLLKKKKLTFSQLVGILPRFYLFRTKVPCPSELNEKVVKLAKSKFKAKKIEILDGLKIWLTSSTWILFRPSGNAPEFRVFAEAKTPKMANKIGEEGINFVKQIINAS